MCGIAGLVGERKVGLVEAMNRVQNHRGPDGCGVFDDSEFPASLGHVRLSILDLSAAAAQPMNSACGRYILSFNGEIYNYKTLRAKLSTPTDGWKTSGDTEVLLVGLSQLGKTFIHELNGMFAFAFWDRFEKKLLLARDHLGIKPLYYALPSAASLLFASEIKSLFAYGTLPREVNFAALQEHLAFGHASGNHTALKGVQRVPAGTILEWSRASPTPHLSEFWRPNFNPGKHGEKPAEIEALRRELKASVSRQLVSDVPVGAFLSGGLDSTLITKLATAENQDIRLYTSVIPSKQNSLDQMPDDSPFARRFAADSGLPITEVPLSSDEISKLPELLWHMDEPIADPAIINCFLLSRIARNDGVKVLLSGQGADELFGGYPRYRAIQIAAKFSKLPGFFKSFLQQIGRLTPGGLSGKCGATLRRFRRIVSALNLPLREQFLTYSCGADPNRVHAILSPDIQATLAEESPLETCLKHMAQRGIPGVDGCLERDLAIYLPNHNLMYTDKMGMACGVETRVPLIDIEVTNLVTPWPSDWKVGRNSLKAILREAASGIIPDEFIWRKKAGFAAPYRFWLRNELKDIWEDCASESAIRRRGWFSTHEIASIRRESQLGFADHYLLQWAILTVELWARAFIDDNPAREQAVL